MSGDSIREVDTETRGWWPWLERPLGAAGASREGGRAPLLTQVV